MRPKERMCCYMEKMGLEKVPYIGVCTPIIKRMPRNKRKHRSILELNIHRTYATGLQDRMKTPMLECVFQMGLVR